MNLNPEVLIVGAGPTGLMLACQLLRFGIDFRIIDQQADRTHESRAFGIQAKSMEIFQNLGIVDEFLKHAIHGGIVKFFINGKMKLTLNLNQMKIKDSPFSTIFFLPQFETERILIEYIEKKGVHIERQIKLENFSQTYQNVKALVKNTVSGVCEDIICQYIIGCDGAHSAVRRILNIPFLGADYLQKFFLADTRVNWPLTTESGLMFFFDKAGFFLHAPISQGLSRIIGAKIKNADQKGKTPLTLQEIESLAQQITHMPLSLTEPVWMARFYLHHRVVRQYQKDRGFLAGDAAHIHSPVGAQGMNTGLQDATNLAWKIALKLKHNTAEDLLNSYQLERQFIGEKLTRTTDKVFLLLTSSNRLLMILRPFILSIIMKLIAKSSRLKIRMFWLMSQLGIYYPKNKFIEEKIDGADAKFLAGPKAGFRAPDAPLGNLSIYELLRENYFNIFIFQKSTENILFFDDNKIIEIEISYKNWVKFHKIFWSSDTKIIFDRYGISDSGVYFIRPDGYIGFRDCKLNQKALLEYMKKIFGN